jgi:hypothetical protein
MENTRYCYKRLFKESITNQHLLNQYTNDRIWYLSDGPYKGRLSTHSGQSGYSETELSPL